MERSVRWGQRESRGQIMHNLVGHTKPLAFYRVRWTVYSRRVTRSDIKRSLCLQGEVATEAGAGRLVRRLLPKSKWNTYTSGQTKVEIVTMVRSYPKGSELWSPEVWHTSPCIMKHQTTQPTPPAIILSYSLFFSIMWCCFYTFFNDPSLSGICTFAHIVPSA